MNESLGEEFIEACTKGDVETVQTLAKGNCDVNHVNNDGTNGFMLACSNGHKDIVELLVTKSNCDVNHVNKNGWNGFMYACQNDHKDIVELLVTKSSCDVRVMNKSNKTAFDYAYERDIKLLILKVLIYLDFPIHCVRASSSIHC